MNLDNKLLDLLNFWGKEGTEEELLREEKFPLVAVQTAIARIVLKKYCDSYAAKKILDAGAGIGRYSLPLANDGYTVTHMDISIDMINKARQRATKAEIENLNFFLGSIIDISDFQDETFDLTLSFDAPVSYSYPYHVNAIKELCRVTKNILLLMVTNLNGVIPFMIDFDLARDYLPPNYDKHLDAFHVTKSIIKNNIEIWPKDVYAFLEEKMATAPIEYCFRIDEIVELVSQEGFEIVEMGGPGALARSIKPANLDKIVKDLDLFDQFTKLSMNFDFDQNNIGLGAVNLLVVAKRIYP